MSNKTFTGVYIDEALLNQISASLRDANCRSRNEFIIEAVRHYISYLHSENFGDIVSPALESVIGAKIKDTENRLARVLFKQGVEIAMMMHVVAATNNIALSELEKLRRMCVDEVSRNSGRYSFDDAVRYQKS